MVDDAVFNMVNDDVPVESICALLDHTGKCHVSRRRTDLADWMGMQPIVAIRAEAGLVCGQVGRGGCYLPDELVGLTSDKTGKKRLAE